MLRDWNICELIRATGLSPAIIRGPALFVSLHLTLSLCIYISVPLLLLSLSSFSSFRSWYRLIFLSSSANFPWPSTFSLTLNLPPEAFLILMIPLYSIQKYQCYPILRKIEFNYDCQARIDPFTVLRNLLLGPLYQEHHRVNETYGIFINVSGWQFCNIYVFDKNLINRTLI